MLKSTIIILSVLSDADNCCVHLICLTPSAILTVPVYAVPEFVPPVIPLHVSPDKPVSTVKVTKFFPAGVSSHPEPKADRTPVPTFFTVNENEIASAPAAEGRAKRRLP